MIDLVRIEGATYFPIRVGFLMDADEFDAEASRQNVEKTAGKLYVVSTVAMLHSKRHACAIGAINILQPSSQTVAKSGGVGWPSRRLLG